MRTNWCFNFNIKQMKRIILVFSFIITLGSCAQKNANNFEKEALKYQLITPENKLIGFEKVLKKHQGKTIVLDMWASWCSDCVKGMPALKDLQAQFPKVQFVYISMDKTAVAWKNGIKKHNLQGDHYLTSDGMKGVFGKSIQLDWIPRYMVVDASGKIVLYKAIEANDPQLIAILKKLNK